MPAVEEFDLAPAEVNPTAEPVGRRRARVWPWAAAAAALVAGGIVAAPTGGIPLGTIPQDQVAMLAVDVSGSPTETWRADLGAWHGGGRHPAVIGSTVVAITDDVQGIDLASGDVQWRVEVSTAACTVHDAVSCVIAASTPGAVVVRVALDGSTTEIPVPGAVRAVDVGSDLVVLATGDPDQRVRRVTPEGATVWAAGLPARVTESEVTELGVAAEWMSMVALGERLYVSGATVATYDLADGALVEDEPVTAVSRTGYGYLIYRGIRPDSIPSITLVDDEGRVRVERIVMAPDDDPGSPIEVSREVGTLVTRDDDVLWQDQQAYPVARVAGVLLLVQWDPETGEQRLSGHDLVTGEQLWERTGTAEVASAGGDALLLWDHQTGELQGIDVRTGGDLWSFGHGLVPSNGILLPDGLVLFQGVDVVRLSW